MTRNVFEKTGVFFLTLSKNEKREKTNGNIATKFKYK